MSEEKQNNTTLEAAELSSAHAGQEIPSEIDHGESSAGPDGTSRVKIYCHKCGQKLDVTGFPAFSVVRCPSCDTGLIVPKWFDSYLLEEIVGEGGMAIVYRALDIALDREVAIKIMNVGENSSEELLSLFLSEARTAATINHHAVIPIYTCAVFEGKPYIVMEFMTGGSLEDLIEKADQPLPVVRVCEWILNVAEGLERAEKYGIVHHDIKPANIMLDSDGNVKIGDFGIAQRRLDNDMQEQQEATSWGSPNYLSPEKAKYGEETFTGDIYSLGATFYHLLTGSTPFHGYENVEELVYVRIEKDPPPPNQLRPEIPPEISSLVMKMMDREPAMRPPYSEIMAALAFFIRKSKSKNLNSRRSSYSRRSVVPSMAENPAQAAVQPQIREFTMPEEKVSMQENSSAGTVHTQEIQKMQEAQEKTEDQEPEKKKNTTLIVIVALVSVVLAILLFSGLFFLFRVLFAAIK